MIMFRFLFTLFISLFSFSFAIADNADNEDNEVKAKYVDPIDWATVTVDYEDITFPWTISVPAPEVTISNVTGPCGAINTNWEVKNGMLYLTIKGSLSVQFADGGDFYVIVVGGASLIPYKIKIVVNN